MRSAGYPKSFPKTILSLASLFSLLAILPAPAHAVALVTVPRDEHFQAGQALTIEVPLDTAGLIRGGYPIDSAGYVDLPVLGRVYVNDRSQDEVEAFLSEKLANYLKDTHIKVSPAMRLTMLGYWAKQGQYYVPPNTTVWEAARMAGGMGGERTIDKIRVLRGSKETDIPFLDEYSKGHTLVAAGFHSGDIIVIPVPRDNAGFWYWFRESLNVTAQIATIVGSVVTLYITYELLHDQQARTAAP